MNPPLHVVTLVPTAHSHAEAAVRVVTRHEDQWGRPVFRAPALPTPHQFYGELPFTTNFRPRSKPPA